jgi:hypothetical protein
VPPQGKQAHRPLAVEKASSPLSYQGPLCYQRHHAAADRIDTATPGSPRPVTLYQQALSSVDDGNAESPTHARPHWLRVSPLGEMVAYGLRKYERLRMPGDDGRAGRERSGARASFLGCRRAAESHLVASESWNMALMYKCRWSVSSHTATVSFGGNDGGLQPRPKSGSWARKRARPGTSRAGGLTLDPIDRHVGTSRTASPCARQPYGRGAQFLW